MKPFCVIQTLNKTVRWIIAGLMLAMVGCTLWQVIVRFLLTAFGLTWAAPWTEELARYCMIWIIFLGAGLACRHAQLIALEIVVQRLPDALGKAIAYVAIAACVAFYGLMLSLGMEFLEYGSIESSPVLGIPKNWVYWSLPVGFALMIINTLTLAFEARLKNVDIRIAGQALEVN